MDSRKCQTVTATPAKPGELPVGLVCSPRNSQYKLCDPRIVPQPFANGSEQLSDRGHTETGSPLSLWEHEAIRK
jgi:hypothetical protein